MSWSFTADLADPQVRAQNTKTTTVRGFYKVRLVQQEYYEKDTHHRAVIYGRILEGPEKGRMVRTGMNIPTRFTEEKKARFFLGFWKALLQSIGKADNKKAKLSWEKTFKGAVAFCEFIPAATEDDWPETLWLTEDAYLEGLNLTDTLDDEVIEEDDEEEDDEVIEEDEVEVIEEEEEPEEEPAPKKTTKRKRKKAASASDDDPLGAALNM